MPPTAIPPVPKKNWANLPLVDINSYFASIEQETRQVEAQRVEYLFVSRLLPVGPEFRPLQRPSQGSRLRCSQECAA